MMNRISRPLDIRSVQPIIVGILTSAFYFVAVALTLRDYASIEWGLYRIHYGAIDLDDLIAIIPFVVLGGAFVPRSISSPSSLLLIICYLFIVIPAGVCLTAMDDGSSVNRYITMFFVLGGFVMASMICQSGQENVDEGRRPLVILGPALLVGAVLLLIFLYLRFGAVMSFVSLDNLYEQRERGAAQNFIEGYAQTYSQYVFSTGLAAFGLYRKNLVYIGIGLAGSIMNFAITAEKSGLMFPIFIVALYFAIASGKKILCSTYFVLIFLALVLIIATLTYQDSDVSDLICWYFGTRTVLTPGIFIAHYTDFFYDRGYTYFSHIRGLNFFLPVPVQYLSDVRWPALGLIVGEDFIGFPELNANASFVATDGIASFGQPGIILAFLIFAILMRVLDWAGRGIPNKLLLPLLLPIALTLTNGSALSVLTSTGGIFWIILLRFAFSAPRDAKLEASR